MQFEPIGFLESCYPDKFGAPRQPGLVEHSWARLKIDRKWQPEEALQGLEGFSHLWLIFVFHKNGNARYHAKVHPPRLGGETRGVFATRTPHRPNPLGLSLVKIVKIEKDSVVVSGVDMIEGTPVLDIKPYLPEIESQPGALAGWTQKIDPKEVQVEWTESQLASLESWSQSLKKEPSGYAHLAGNELRQLIEETLALDPRPVIYRGYEGSEDPKYRHQHAVRFLNADVHFEFRSQNQIKILELRLS